MDDQPSTSRSRDLARPLMQQRAFGNTGLSLSVLGFGAGNIGDPGMSEADVENLLNTALDLGITLFDTARSYGLSEERIGRHLHHRRNQVVLSTKVGYGIPGYQDWTGPMITAGIENALRLLQTDRIDIVHLHSCPLHVLQQGDVVNALSTAVAAGKIRVAAYSGDNDEALWAAESGRFGSIQSSINICDQKAIATSVAEAERRGLGVIAKRSLANSIWRFPQKPAGDAALENYWERWQLLARDIKDEEPGELALRFSLSFPAVHSCLVGTRSAINLKENARIAEKGPLPEEIILRLRQAFARHGAQWPGVI
jgi:aryl-alcohol dehydrogenase-like predicted oxidoreductase